MFEIFNRLNTGGINLKPQEIRTSLYHSRFYSMIYRVNALPEWRKLTGIEVPDLNMKDCEVILRSFAMLIDGSTYKPSMIRFLNDFSRKMRTAKQEQVVYLENLFVSFLEACRSLPDKAFVLNRGRFSISVFESVFAAACASPLQNRTLLTKTISPALIKTLQEDNQFMEAAQKAAAGTANVETRLRIAREKFAHVV
jgi:hypothetical protein